VDSEIAATSTFVYSTMCVQFVEKNKIPRQGTPLEITWKWGDSDKVESMVDLGVRFDNNLTFRDHISEKN